MIGTLIVGTIIGAGMGIGIYNLVKKDRKSHVLGWTERNELKTKYKEEYKKAMERLVTEQAQEDAENNIKEGVF